MKRYTYSLFASLLIPCSCISCSNHHHSGNISLTISESDQYYKVYAAYPEESTRDVAYYMNKKLGDNSNMSFINTNIDARLILNDGTKLYVKNEPGELEIRFDKEENTNAAY